MTTGEQHGVSRRLAAILSADVAGYSRLMESDEVATLRALKAHRRELVDPAIAARHGRIVKTTGDGLLAEFHSIVDAVACAVAVQRGMIGRNAAVPEDRRMRFRIGINIANEPIRDKLMLAFADMGERTVKNIARSIGVFGLAPQDIALLPEEISTSGAAESPSQAALQQIRFCRTADGVQLAYARMGQGPPLVKAGAFMTHLEKELESPIWRHLWRDLARVYTVIRYDARGNGLSDWEVDELSFDAFVRDLETVVDAAGLGRFPLLGISQGCAVSIAYAVRDPERVTRLVLHGGFAQGAAKRARNAAEREQLAAVMTLVRLGCGQENPAFRQIFTSEFVPEGTKEQIDWWNELQWVSTSPENAARFISVVGNIDVTDPLAKVAVPTLVMHARDETRIPFDAGRRMAAGIPRARFVPLESRNHLILESEPAYARFLEEIRSFLHA